MVRIDTASQVHGIQMARALIMSEAPVTGRPSDHPRRAKEV
jgi:hypothetical protein